MKKYEKPSLLILKVDSENVLAAASSTGEPTGVTVSDKSADAGVAPLAKENKWPSYNVWEDEL